MVSNTDKNDASGLFPSLEVGQTLCALDLGSSKIACLIGRLEEDRQLQVIGHSMLATDGIRQGMMTDMVVASGTVAKAIEEAEKTAGVTVERAIVNVPGAACRMHTAAIQSDIGNRAVRVQDVRSLLDKIPLESLPSGEGLIQYLIHDCAVDGTFGIQNPVGLYGSRLEYAITLVTALPSHLQNVISCLSQAHMEVDVFCSAAYATGLSCLVDDERTLGAAVLDIGAQTTDVAVFQSGNLLFAGGVPLGGHHITQDIARCLSISLPNAERIKTLHGQAMKISGGDSKDTKGIEIALLGEEHTEKANITHGMLTGIIQPRLEEIFELTQGLLKHAGIDEHLTQRLVLTGGSSQMTAIRELAQISFGKQVRLGKPLGLVGISRLDNPAGYATAAGLLKYGMTMEYGRQQKLLSSGGKSSGMMGKFWSWISS